MKKEDLMSKALALASEGHPRKNPYVGAILVKDGKIIGEGYHAGDGQIHAEQMAIESSVTNVKDSILYTTLEPCFGSWEGKKNPPCCELIKKSGIKSVVIASLDPNPNVNGKGVEFLKSCNIKVVTGVLRDKENLLNRKYITKHKKKRPYIHLKMAQTLDGRIARNFNRPVSITGKQALNKVHQLRGAYESILIGIGTLIADNPELTARRVDAVNPLRVVLDSNLKIPLYCNLCNTKLSSTLVYHNSLASNSRKENLNKLGIETRSVATSISGKLSLTDIINDLYSLDFGSILVEGGSHIAASFLEENLVDEVSWFIAPSFGGSGVTTLSSETSLWEYPGISRSSVSILGEDICIEGLTTEVEECLQA